MSPRFAHARRFAWLMLAALGMTAHGGARAQTAPAPAPAAPRDTTAIPGSTGVVVMDTSLGTLVIRLFEADAPLTCANFKKLVRSRYYDSTYFHRVVPGFMIQGGDPNTRNANLADDGAGGPGYSIPAEIKRPNLRGSVAAARRGAGVNPSRESSGSQFFIEVADQPRLDEEGYTVFGQLIDGFETLDAIEKMGSEPGLPKSAAGGLNPGRTATIRTATWMTYAQWKARPATRSPQPPKQ